MGQTTAKTLETLANLATSKTSATSTTSTNKDNTNKLLANYLTSILVGKTGAGKTTLINQLCDLDRKAGVGESQTRDIDLLLVCHGDAFAIIDTPGVDSDEETYKHSYLLYHALTAKPVNGIFLVVRYDCRHNNIVTDFADLKAMLPDSCSANLFTIITRWDEATSPEVEKTQILERFSKIGISDERIIFKGKNSKVLDLSMQIHSYLKKSSPMRLQISKEDFYKNFQITAEAKKGYAEYKNEFQRLLKTYEESVASYLNETKETSEDRDDFLHFVIIDFKDTLSKKLDEFSNKYGPTMEDLDWYSLYIKLKKQFVALCSEFSDSLQELMTANLNDPNDLRNLVKRCSKCGLVWIKVEGCDGLTTCGSKASSLYDIKEKVSAFRYFSTWENRKLKFQKVNNDWKKLSKTVSHATQSTKGIGCGAQIEWRSLPRLQKNEIKALFNVASIDQVLKLIKDPASILKTKEYEKKLQEEIPDRLK